MIAKALGMSLLLGALVLTAGWIMERRVEGFLAGWFFFMILPNSNVFPLDVLIADRYLYLPCIGLFAIVSIAITRIWTAREDKVGSRLVYMIIGVLIAVLGVRSWDESTVWKDDITFYSEIASENPEPRILAPLVAMYQDTGRIDLMQKTAAMAIRVIHEELPRQPDNWALHQQLGLVYRRLGKTAEAKDAYLRAMRLKDNALSVLIPLSAIYLQEQDYDRAVDLLNRTIRTYPYLPEPHVYMVNALVGRGDYPAARRLAEDAVRRWPDNPVAVGELADLCRMAGEKGRAVELYRRILQTSPGSSISNYADTMIRQIERTP
jgi:protein O-mannosyl-transferase